MVSQRNINYQVRYTTGYKELFEMCDPTTCNFYTTDLRNAFTCPSFGYFTTLTVEWAGIQNRSAMKLKDFDFTW